MPFPASTRAAGALILLLLTAAASAQLPIPMTQNDFHVPGSQIGDMPASELLPSDQCKVCHDRVDPQTPPENAVEPYATWAGSLMGLSGRDPLFFAQTTTANQDVDNVGSFCIRCHMPASVVTGHVSDPWGTSFDQRDLEGVSCHMCHAMVDPIYQPGVSPPEDESILAALADVPEYYGNAMFVLDPLGVRRGPRADNQALHQLIVSPFTREASFCGTCHDVGNVAVSRQLDGSYRYNTIDEEAPDHDQRALFPLERTYTEWKLSAFAAGGVDLGGRFGGARGPVVSTCQDCHMPTAPGQASPYGPQRPDIARHEFAGAAVQSLDLIAAYTANDPTVDPELPGHIAVGRAKALSMLQRAASLDLALVDGNLRARVTNETGHKLPTGHIEGRRVWLNLQFFDAADQLVLERGHYDPVEAELDASSTTVYEMHVALSADAAAATGLPAGVTTHMALADTIAKDTRIPPRGFNNASFLDGGSPAVGISYADGQYWHDTELAIPPGAVRVRATLYYQSLPREYIEALRDGNVTDDWGDTLHDLWEQTGRGAPIEMISKDLHFFDAIFASGFDDTLPP